MNQQEPADLTKSFLERYPAFLIDVRSGDDRFKTFSKDEVLDGILPVSREISVPSGTVLLEQGKPNYELFILLKGKLDIISDGKPVLQLKRCGDIVGEISFVSGVGSFATVFTATDSIVLSIEFQKLVGIGELKDFLLSCLANKVTWTTQLKNASDAENKAVIVQTRTELIEEKNLRQELEKAYDTIQKQNQSLRELNSKLSEHSKELERARGSESAFLQYISHELRTPLHHILGFSTILLNKEADAGCLENVKMIERSGQNLLRYINRLLDLSFLHNSEVDITLDRLPLNSYINDISCLLEETLADEGYKLELRLCEDRAIVSLDQAKLLDVLKELIDNARKFSEAPGPIIIETMADNGSVICFVKDHGIGIPQAELNSIFDEFTQSSKTDAGASGKGIGLSICKKIIELHSGKIWAGNNPDGGAIISFSIPRSTD